MALHNWKQGDQVTALRLQQMTDSIKQNNAAVANIVTSLGGFAGEPAIPVYVYNSLTRDIKYGETIGLGGQAITDNIAKRVLTAEEINTSNHLDNFAIASKTIAQGTIGKAYAIGICLAIVDVSDTDHKYAAIATSDTTLVSGVTGQCKIIWKESGTGEKWSVVKLGIHNNNVESVSTPYTIPAGTTDSIETTTWDIFNQPSGYDGVKYTPVRMYWSGTSGNPVYLFTRQPTYDVNGNLIAVSAEVRSTVFSTDTC